MECPIIALSQRHFLEPREGGEESKSIRFFNGWPYKEEYFPGIARGTPATMLWKVERQLWNKFHEEKLGSNEWRVG